MVSGNLSRNGGDSVLRTHVTFLPVDQVDEKKFLLVRRSQGAFPSRRQTGL